MPAHYELTPAVVSMAWKHYIQTSNIYSLPALNAAANSNTLEGMRAALADLVIGGRHDHASARELMDSILRLTSDEAEKHEFSRMRRMFFL